MEELMYYVWQHRMLQQLEATGETKVEIIHPGIRNLDAGPDFFNAKIKIDGTLWAGNVEMHVKASDWFRHNHQEDKAYESVILHVVLNADAVIRLRTGEVLKTVVMKIPPEVMKRYEELTEKRAYSYSAINCKARIGTVEPIVLHDWQTALAVERMLTKAQRVKDIITDDGRSWPEALYVSLARALGTGINSDACERLARSLPYSFLQKHLDKLEQIEALLLGQAGLSMNKQQAEEYAFLRAKFSLTPLPPETWKMARTRPQASPQVRLQAMARILCRNTNLFSSIMQCEDANELTRIISVPRLLGKATLHSLIINAIVPIVLAYAQWQGDTQMFGKAINLLESLPAESNRFMNYWTECGIPLKNALDSQAMLQLYKEYCEPHKCMRCRIGCWLLKH